MSNNYNKIDEMLRAGLKDYTSSPSADLREKMSLKIKKFNFFKFNLGSFNIFYLAAIVFTVSSITAFTSGIFTENKTESSHTKSDNIVIEDASEKTNPSDNRSPSDLSLVSDFDNPIKNSESNPALNLTEDNKNAEKKRIIETPSIKNNNLVYEPSEDNSSIIKTVNHENFTEKNSNDYKSAEKTDIIVDTSENATKTITDTIYNIVRTNIYDTSKVEISKTIKIKKKRRK